MAVTMGIVIVVLMTMELGGTDGKTMSERRMNSSPADVGIFFAEVTALWGLAAASPYMFMFMYCYLVRADDETRKGAGITYCGILKACVNSFGCRLIFGICRCRPQGRQSVDSLQQHQPHLSRHVSVLSEALHLEQMDRDSLVLLDRENLSEDFDWGLNENLAENFDEIFDGSTAKLKVMLHTLCAVARVMMVQMATFILLRFALDTEMLFSYLSEGLSDYLRDPAIALIAAVKATVSERSVWAFYEYEKLSMYEKLTKWLYQFWRTV